MEIVMPRLADTMEDGAVALWHKQVGDTVSRGEVLCEIETEKVTMEYASDYDGRLTAILVEPNVVVPIGHPIATLELQ